MTKHVYQGIGVYSTDDLRYLVSSERIQVHPGFSPSHIGSASIDITVAGGEAYRVDRIMHPSGKRREKIRDMLPGLGAKRIELGSTLEPGSAYIAPATISPNFPPGIYGYSNAKSTSGRNMVLCRTIADQVEGYDTVDRRWEGWNGELWLTIEPLVFPIVLTDKECYSQVRIFDGDTRFGGADLERELTQRDLLYRQDGSRYKQGELGLITNDGTVFTTLFAKAGKLVGFRARKTRKSLDLTFRGLEPCEYFEPVYAEEDPTDTTGGLITLEPGWYYLLSTNEMLHVPEHLSAELVAVNPRLGLFFSHFAGYFDPGFKGVPTLEVTCVVRTTIRHREAVGCFRYERMRSRTIPYGRKGNYQSQTRTTLPKQFLMPPQWVAAMA